MCRTNLTVNAVLLIVGLIIVGLVIDLGGAPSQDRIGFRYWKDPGVFAGGQSTPNKPDLGRFLGFLRALTPAAFSIQGLEAVAM